jgi:hypothetical protein
MEMSRPKHTGKRHHIIREEPGHRAGFFAFFMLSCCRGCAGLEPTAGSLPHPLSLKPLSLEPLSLLTLVPLSLLTVVPLTLEPLSLLTLSVLNNHFILLMWPQLTPQP